MRRAKQIETEILRQISKYKPTIEEQVIGSITSLADGVAIVSGLDTVAYNEMLEFPHGAMGVAINLEESSVGAIVLGDYLQLKQGDEVRGTGQLLSVPVGEAMVGRVVNPLGRALDKKGEIEFETFNPIEKIAPGVIARKPVDTPLQTGIKAIDAITPIGRGQRELIIGDRSTGKTAIVLDTIINQKNSGVVCIYVAVGQKASRIAQIVEELKQHQALDHSIIVSAPASAAASLQYLAPYTGCAIGEYFMSKGRDALVIYDDLSKHAWAYRQIALILKRPSGREAYPGDVFYLHSRLLERACRLNKKHGGGSLTALPIIETQAGDLSSYIPTNVISITDGQIYLESDLFHAGIRPAVSVGLSVSRVGGAAQLKAMKQVAGKLRLTLAQYRDLAAFTQFASDLDPDTKSQIDRGARMTELLKQPQWKPLAVEHQIVSLWAGVNGYLDDIPKEKVVDFEKGWLDMMQTQAKKILQTIKKEQKLTEKTEKELIKLITDYKQTWQQK